MPTTRPQGRFGPINGAPVAMPLIRSRNPAFAKIWDGATDAEQEYLAAMHQHHEREMQKALATGNSSEEITAALHVVVDFSVKETLKSPNGKRVQCAKGCAHCCHLHVTVSEGEATLLAHAITDKHISIDRGRLKVQAAHEGPESWGQMKPEDRRCVLLGNDDSCRLYDFRPMQCRKYMVASKPWKCDTIRHMGEQVAIVAPIEAETVIDVAMSALEWGSFAAMLDKALDKVECHDP